MHRKSRELEIFALWLEEEVKITRGLEQGCAGRLTTSHAGNRQTGSCRRLPEGLFVGQEQDGKLPIDPGADLPVICC
jgi:uncharacterized protein YcaQ